MWSRGGGMEQGVGHGAGVGCGAGADEDWVLPSLCRLQTRSLLEFAFCWSADCAHTERPGSRAVRKGKLLFWVHTAQLRLWEGGTEDRQAAL